MEPSKSSDTFAAEKSSHFAVNILNQQQQDLSNNYAQKGSHDLEDDHFSNGQTGLPLINNAIVSFECEIDACHDGGDHIIMVGKVVAMSGVEAHFAIVIPYAGKYRALVPLDKLSYWGIDFGVVLKFCSHCGNKVALKIPEGDNRPRYVCQACGLFTIKTLMLWLVLFLFLLRRAST